MKTIEELLGVIKQAASENRMFSCDQCGWEGNEPILSDYDDRGPHFECPVCKTEITKY